jgi:hypothetical protein
LRIIFAFKLSVIVASGSASLATLLIALILAYASGPYHFLLHESLWSYLIPLNMILVASLLGLRYNENRGAPRGANVPFLYHCPQREISRCKLMLVIGEFYMGLLWTMSWCPVMYLRLTRWPSSLPSYDPVPFGTPQHHSASSSLDPTASIYSLGFFLDVAREVTRP